MVTGGTSRDDSSDPLAPHRSTPTELKALLEVQRGGLPFLSVRDVDGRLHLWPLESGAPIRIGRRPANDVCLSWDDTVSGVHAELECISEEWVVVDDGLSTYGTFLNGERVQGRRRLRPGDRMRLGRTVVRFDGGTRSSHTVTRPGAEAWSADGLTPMQKSVLQALCRPCVASVHAAPASNSQIAAEVSLSIDGVKSQLGKLFTRFGLADLEQNQKRAALAALALEQGIVSRRDYG